jgi:hypothetical protein
LLPLAIWFVEVIQILMVLVRLLISILPIKVSRLELEGLIRLEEFI